MEFQSITMDSRSSVKYAICSICSTGQVVVVVIKEKKKETINLMKVNSAYRR